MKGIVVTAVLLAVLCGLIQYMRTSLSTVVSNWRISSAGAFLVASRVPHR